MENQNQIEVTKRRRTAKCAIRIFKWLFITVLALLLIVGLVFQAPYKITALLLILFLGCTVLPKHFRKWFWLGIGGVIAVLIIWLFLPGDNEGWRPFTFDKELSAFEAKHVIPEEENAARFYNDLFKEYKKYEEPSLSEKMAAMVGAISIADVNDLPAGLYGTFYPEFWNYELDKLTLEEFWSSQDYPQIAEWLGIHKNTITTLIEASQKNKCRFPIASDSASLNKSIDRLPSLRRWKSLLIRSANNDFGDGRIDQAIEKYIALLQMIKHQYQQPLIVEHLVGLSMEAPVAKQLNRFIITGKATEAHLNLIEDAFSKIEHDWKSDLVRILEYETLIGKNITCSLYFQRNPRGKVRLSHNPIAITIGTLPEKMPPPTYWQKRLMKSGIILAWFVLPSTPEKLASIVEKAHEGLYAMAAPEYDWEKVPKTVSLFSTSTRLNYSYALKLSVDRSGDMFRRIHAIYLRTMVKQRGCRIMIALRRYKNINGDWPQSLDDIRNITLADNLVDPSNGLSFVYKLTDDGFTLYSKGKNGIDENGEIKDTWPIAEPDDWLIWPQPGRTRKNSTLDKE